MTALSLALLSGLPTDGTFLGNVLPISLLAAVGMSLAYIPVTMTGMGGAAPQDMGLASGLINTTYQVGSALGLAGMVSLAAWMGGDADALLSDYQMAFLGAAVVAGIAAVAALALVRGQAAASDVPVGGAIPALAQLGQATIFPLYLPASPNDPVFSLDK